MKDSGTHLCFAEFENRFAQPGMTLMTRVQPFRVFQGLSLKWYVQRQSTEGAWIEVSKGFDTYDEAVATLAMFTYAQWPAATGDAGETIPEPSAPRPRAADDFDAIRTRLEELRRSGEIRPPVPKDDSK